MQTTIVILDFSGKHKPFAKIVDTKSQIICALIARDGEHLTIHKQKISDNLLIPLEGIIQVASTARSTVNCFILDVS